MITTKYTLKPFNVQEAACGGLCAMVNNSLNVPIAGIDIESSNSAFISAGICQFDNNTYAFTYNKQAYIFDNNGVGTSNNAINYKLVSGTIVTAEATAGTAVNVMTTKRVIRNNSGVTETTATGTTGGSVIVDRMNARDEFAVQVLRGFFSEIKDPVNTPDNLINYYCNKAYDWASGMMLAAAEARATLDDNSTSTVQTTVTDLENNTEILLNNLVSAVNALNNSISTLQGIISRTDRQLSDQSYLKNVYITEMSGTVTVGDESIGSAAHTPIYVQVNPPDNTTMDARIKAWLQATTIVSDGNEGWELNVPNSI